METKTIYIQERKTYSEKALKNALSDVAKVSEFAKNGEISLKDKSTKQEIVLKPESETLKDMETLSNTLKDKVVKYAFDKKRLFKARNQTRAYFESLKTEA
jgi:hypothetical protein